MSSLYHIFHYERSNYTTLCMYRKLTLNAHVPQHNRMVFFFHHSLHQEGICNFLVHLQRSGKDGKIIVLLTSYS